MPSLITEPVKDAREYLKPDVLAKVGDLELIAKFIVEGFVIGMHRSPYHGFSVEFSSYRRYTPGDDPKFVDWRVFGRTEKFYVKQFEDTTNMNCCLAIDLSRSMAYADGAVSKFQYSGFLCAGLTYLMLRQGDCVGMAAFARDHFEYHRPSGRPGWLINLLSALARLTPDGETDFTYGIGRIAERMRRRGMVIVFSDFLTDPNAVVESLRYLRYLNHEVLAFCVLTDSEIEFPFRSNSAFEDAETGRLVVAEPGLIRDDYRKALQEHLAFLRRKCEEAEIDFRVLRTSQSVDEALLTYLSHRSARM